MSNMSHDAVNSVPSSVIMALNRIISKFYIWCESNELPELRSVPLDRGLVTVRLDRSTGIGKHVAQIHTPEEPLMPL
jgi:hypothetical protein